MGDQLTGSGTGAVPADPTTGLVSTRPPRSRVLDVVFTSVAITTLIGWTAIGTHLLTKS